MSKVVAGQVILVCSLCFLAVTASGQGDPKMPPESGLRLVREFEGGKLYRAEKLNVLELHGSYRQMGRQHGGLLKDQLEKFYETAIVERFIRKERVTADAMTRLGRRRFALYPQRFKEILYGMAEASGMEPDKLMHIDNIWSLCYMTPPPEHCSAIAAWGEYTPDGRLVLGRNFDYPAYFKEFAEFLTLIVYNPTSDIPAASFGYAGQIATNSGMNKAGLFVELNNGSVSGGEIYYSNRVPVPVMNLAFLLDCTNMAGLDAAIITARAHYTFILTVADPEAARCYEWPTFDVKLRQADHPGLVVATNHFVDPSWGIGLPTHDSPTRSVRRRENLLALTEKCKGKIDEQKMMEILDTPFAKGGATWPDRTIYQMVAVPQELRLWLKAPGCQEWVNVGLGKLFAGQK